MDRLQKKCFIASSGLHLLLVLMLFLGSAFLGKQEKPVTLQYIDVIPFKVIEAPFVGGGNPNAKPPPPAPQVQPQPQPVQPAAAQPPPPEKSAPREKESPPSKPDDSLEVNDQKPRKPQINLQNVVSRKTGRTKPTETVKDSNSTSQSQAKENAAKMAQFQNVLQSLKDGRSSGTTIDIQGPGGEAYAGYEIVLQSIYKRSYDAVLSTSADIADSTASVEVSVTIERSGNVTASRIVTSSGNAALDKVVKRVLSQVTYIRPFPEGSKDSERTFNIIFDLKSKRAIG